jgi:ABC-type glutathione transport system ATPase component
MFKIQFKQASTKTFHTFLRNENNDVSKSQILMYVGGAAGTGKSQVIKAVRQYFSKTNQEDKLKIAAFTASASLSISGSTIHSLIGLSIDQNVNS